MDIDFFRDSATDVVLEIEVHPNGVNSFEEWYQNTTGHIPELGVGYQHQSNKWGRECRIYFNSNTDLFDEFANIAVAVETGRRPYRSNRIYRVNNCDFFNALISGGYRLGEN